MKKSFWTADTCNANEFAKKAMLLLPVADFQVRCLQVLAYSTYASLEMTSWC